MQFDYFQVLEFLKKNNGLNRTVSIAPLILKAIPKGLTYNEFLNYGMKPIYKVLGVLQQDGMIKEPIKPAFNADSYVWEQAIDIQVGLTLMGESTLRERELQEQTAKVNQSAFETNETIKGANEAAIKSSESVIKTNNVMSAIADRQLILNSLLADNARTQTNILNRQTIIFFFTGLISLVGLVISGINLYRDTEKATLKKQLQLQSIQQQSLRRQLLQLQNKQLHQKEVQTDETKKN